MNVVRVKPGVRFDVIAPAGFRILSALDVTARRLRLDFTITCGTEAHGPLDPHTLGEAYDVRTHDFTDDEKRTVLREVLMELSEDQTSDAPEVASAGLGTKLFWGWIEHPGNVSEHIHVQRRKGRTYWAPASEFRNA